MVVGPNFRVIVDGDTTKAFTEGDEVRGRVTLVLEKPARVKCLKVAFTGVCTTKTTRAIYVSGNDACTSKREYEKSIKLFSHERILLSDCSLASNKHSWAFAFTFPTETDAHFSRWSHGKQYPRAPHGLPPTFQTVFSNNNTNAAASISYSVQAKLAFDGSTSSLKATEFLSYLPSSRDTPREAQLRSRVLYAQTWKPTKSTNEPRTRVGRVFEKVSLKQKEHSTVTRIIPTIYAPERIAPAQHIPLKLCLARANIGDYPQCTLDSFKVILSTFTTSVAGHPMAQQEDTSAKHVTCIQKGNINKPLSYSTPTSLTTNFRLIDDAECVPSFRTYTITRRYSMSIIIVLRSEDQTFTVQFNSPLEILPRLPRSEIRRRNSEEDEDFDPLPLYAPPESREFAPDYETLYSLSPIMSVASSVGAPLSARSLSFTSTVSTPSTAPTTPDMEIEQPAYQQAVNVVAQ